MIKAIFIYDTRDEVRAFHRAVFQPHSEQSGILLPERTKKHLIESWFSKACFERGILVDYDFKHPLESVDTTLHTLINRYNTAWFTEVYQKIWVPCEMKTSVCKLSIYQEDLWLVYNLP